MRTVYKYQLTEPSGAVAMPRNAELLHVAVQGVDVCVWALVDTSAPTVNRRIVTRPTGGVIPDDEAAGRYLDTLHIEDRMRLVFHVFDLGESEAS